MLIFSQMTRMLDIPEEYCALRSFSRCLDGGVSVDERQQAMLEFNSDASIDVFLLSTRAGGTSTCRRWTCIIFDSDWNPLDLQAQTAATIAEEGGDGVPAATAATVEEKVLNAAKQKSLEQPSSQGHQGHRRRDRPRRQAEEGRVEDLLASTVEDGAGPRLGRPEDQVITDAEIAWYTVEEGKRQGKGFMTMERHTNAFDAAHRA